MLQGFLPLKITGEKDQYNVAHATFLLRSLDRFWEEPAPFELTIATPPAEIREVRGALHSTERVRVSIVSELELVPELSKFDVSGWYKQMVLKLAFAQHATMPFYLTFDADMMCVRPLSLTLLFRGGRALAQWEPKSWHADWWHTSRLFLQISEQRADIGLSVTPNILSADIARQTLALLAHRRAAPAVEFLLANSDFSKFIWTEYSLYTEAGEELGLLDRDHIPWNDTHRIGRPATVLDGNVETLHVDCSLWDREAFARWRPAEWLRQIPRGYFLIYQSSLGLAPELIQERTRAILTG